METHPTLAWIRHFGSSERDHLEDMAIDPFGNIYLAGSSHGEIGEGGHSGGQDSWIAKMNSRGSLIWIVQLGTEGSERAHGIATDEHGHVYVSGHTTGEKAPGQQQGKTDVWVARYDENGNRVWITQIGSEHSEKGHAIGVNAEGYVYLAGYTRGKIGESTEDSIPPDAFLAKLDHGGFLMWVKHFGTETMDIAYDLTIDSMGHLFLAGYTRGRISTGSGDRGEKQIWVQKFDSEGNKEWIREFGANRKDDEARSITTDIEGNVFVTGSTYLERPSEGLYKRNVFLTKIRPDGRISWSKFLGTGETDIAYGVATDPLGNIFLGGYTRGELEEGKLSGAEDAWIAKYNPAGNLLWKKQLGTYEEDKAEAVATDAFGNVYLSGFGGLTGTSQQTSYHNRVTAWVARFDADLDEKQRWQLSTDYLQHIAMRVNSVGRVSEPRPVGVPGELNAKAMDMVENRGDGRISEQDARDLIEMATDQATGGIPEDKQRELAMIYFKFNLTDPAKEIFDEALS